MKNNFLLLIAIVGILCTTRTYAQSTASAVYSDYQGYWYSGVGAYSTVQPNLSHNMLAFTWNNQIYSTGVNNTVLNNKNISYTSTEFYAFPMTNISLPGTNSNFVGQGALVDGSLTNAYYVGVLPVNAANILTKGLHGLDLGTCITNIPTQTAATALSFNFLGISNTTAIDDGIPDVIVTQVADPSSNAYDQVYFEDNNGNIVGNSLTINQNSLSPLGTWAADFFNPINGASGGNSFINTTRQIRLWCAKLSDFGITTTDPTASSYYTKAVKLRYRLGGTSDPAFLAYNSGSIQLIKANDDIATTSINASTTIPVLDNDLPDDSRLDKSSVTIITAALHGTTSVDPTTGAVTYTPNNEYYGTDVFTYRIANNVAVSGGSLTYSQANVNINIGSPVQQPVFNSGLTKERCQGTGTDTYTATAANSASIAYAITPAAGTINSATGVVTWNNTFFGTAVISAFAIGVDGPKSTDFNVTVDPQPTITLTSAVGTDNQTYTGTNTFQNIEYAIGTNSGFSVSPTTFPTGLTGTYSNNTYTISGTPSQIGDYPYTLTALSTSTHCSNISQSGTMHLLAYPLPVKWLYFRIQNIGIDSIKLEWSTASEINVDHFEIEMSTDQISYTSIEKINAVGNSSTESKYQSTLSTASHVPIFYRIKEIDKDGSFSYSDISTYTPLSQVSTLVLYPNPASESTQVKASSTASVQVYDMSGRSQNISTRQNGENRTISLNRIHPGMYIVVVMEKDKIYKAKLIVAK